MFSMWIIIMPENKDFFLSDIDALIYFLSLLYWVGASLVAQTVKNLPEMQETWVGKILWKREWLPTLVFLPGEFHGQKSLAIYSPWGCKESDTTQRLTHTLSITYMLHRHCEIGILIFGMILFFLIYFYLFIGHEAY